MKGITKIKTKRINFAYVFSVGVLACLLVLGGQYYRASANLEFDISAYVTGADRQSIADGSYEIRFALYTQDRTTSDPYPSNSDKNIWEETQTIEIRNGILRAHLGAINPLPLGLDLAKNQYYMGIRIGNNSEMIPRKRITNTPFSLIAQNAINAITANNATTLQGASLGATQGDIAVVGSGNKFDATLIPALKKLGTVTQGVWQATKITSNYIANSLTGKTYNGLAIATSGNQFSLSQNNNYKLTVSTDVTLDQDLSLTSTPTFAAINLTNGLPVASGGTGLNSLGAANQILGVNNDGTGLEYKNITAGSNVTITHNAGDITISATSGSNYLAGNDLDLVGDTFNLEPQLDYVHTIAYDSGDITLQTTTAGNVLLLPVGNVGIGTTNPTEKLEVAGNIQLRGNLLADEEPRSIGSASVRFENGYFKNLDVTNMSVGGVDISGTTSNTLTVNSDNTSADAEDSFIAFERGTVTPNALIQWDSVNDRFNFSFPVSVNGSLFTSGLNINTNSFSINSSGIVTNGTWQGSAISPTYLGSTVMVEGENNSLLTNDSGYITASSTNTLTNKSGNISMWTNDSGYITASSVNTLTNKTWNGNVINTTYGGTGLSSYTAGDMLYFSSGTSFAKLGIGTNGQVLVVSGGVPTWSNSSPASAHNLLSGIHSDTTAATVQRGDLITGQGASATWSHLALGTSGQFLKSNGTDALWSALAKSDVGLGNVENTALSTWAGSTNITTLGTITSGTWQGSAISPTYLGSSVMVEGENVSLLNNNAGYISNLSSFTTDNLVEGTTNKYYTDARARGAISVTATGLSYNSGTGVISLTGGYAIPTTTNVTNWNTAYSWGNHALAGYLTSYTETDPIFGASAAAGITSGNITNWNSGYTYRLTSASGTSPLTLTLASNALTGSIADASTVAKGVASFNSTNFSVSSGAVNTIQNIATTSSPTFAGLTLTSPLITSSGGVGLNSYTAGDMLYYSSGTSLSKLGIGTNGQVLVIAGGVPTWSNSASAALHPLLSATHSDTTPGTVVKGDLITGQGNTATWSRLAAGTSGQVLSVDDNGDVVWSTITIGGGSGGTIAANSIDFSELKNTMTLDANWNVASSASNYSINFDSGTLYIDTANNRIGIGTTAPSATLSIGNNAFTINSSGTVTAGDWNGSAIGSGYLDSAVMLEGENISLLSNDALYITASSMDTLTNKSGNISMWTNDASYITDLSSFTTDNLTEGTINKYFTNARARSAVSVSATGLAYNSGTGVFSLASGYAIPTTASMNNWDTAYSWGNHADAGYLTSYTETDPIFGASAAAGITGTNITNWNSAYTWGNHALAGYITASSINTLTNKSGNISMWTNDANYITLSSLSSTATGLTYNNSNGVFSLTSGYVIPTADQLSGYITSYTETDPIFGVSAAAGITGTNITNWNMAYANRVDSWNNPLSYSGNTVSLSYDSNNLKLTLGNALTTVQDISTTSSPLFADLTLTGLSGSIFSSTSVKTSLEELSESLSKEGFTGFDSWTSGTDANTYTITSGKFQIDRSGSGFIKGKKVSWSTGQQTGVLAANTTSWIYIDANGTIGATNAPSSTTFANNIVLFEVLYDGTNYDVVRENHPYAFNQAVSGYLHNNAGTVIRGNGALATRVATGTGGASGDRQVKIVGSDYIDDHGLTDTIPDSGGVGVNWQVFYTNSEGKWVRSASQTELPMTYNNSGSISALTNSGATDYNVYTLYVSKTDIENSAPMYIAVMGNGYASSTDAQSAINAGTVNFATNELSGLEMAQLGYAIVQNNGSGGYLSSITVAKSTFNKQLVGGNAGTDHGTLTGLLDDDHLQYMLLAGRVGGQTLIGGTASTDDLVFRTTAGTAVNGANMLFQTGNNGSIEAMRIDYQGNVGIGTTNPSEILDINGRLHIAQISAPGTTTDKLYNVGGALYWNGVQLSSNAGVLPSGTIGQTLYNNGSAWMASSLLFNSGTNIGIGTTNPGSLLTVGNNAFGINNSGVVTVGTWNGNVVGVSYGGTNTNSIGSAGTVAYSNGTSYAFTSVGSSGQVLVSNGSGAPTWSSVSISGGSGGGISADSIDFVDIADNMTLDNNLNISASANNYSINFSNGNLYLDNANNRVGIGTTAPNFTLAVAGDIGPAVDNLYSLGSADKRFNDLYLGPSSLHVVNQYTDASNYEEGFFGYQGYPATDNSLDLDTADESTFTQENIAYNATLTPNATNGNITLTLGSGNWNSDSRMKKGVRVIGNGGEAVINADPAAQSTITATVITNFTNTSAIASGNWMAYGTKFESNTADLSNFIDVVQQAKIQSSPTVADANMGMAVKLSADGNTAAVGAPNEGSYGAVYIFTRSGSTWTQQARLEARILNSGQLFGNSLGLSSDGNTLVVGAYADSNAGVSRGAIYIYTRSGSTWSWQYSFSGAADYDQLGYSVAISDDGSTIMAGANRFNNYTGRVFVYTKTGSVWSYRTNFQSSDISAADHFGEAVDLSSDGTTVLVGAPYANNPTSDVGASYVFTGSGSSWTQQAKLAGETSVGSINTGYSVALSGNGNTAVAGTNNNSYVYIYTRSGSVWSSYTKITPANSSLDISSDGTKLAVGYKNTNYTGAAGAGSLTIFTYTGGNWTQTAKVTSSDREASDNLGYSVAISGDGNTYIAGAPNEDTGANNSGSSYIFVTGPYYTSNNYYTIATSDTNHLNSSTWSKLSTVNVSENLNGQNLYYSVSFDGRSTFKVYDSTLGNSGWRPIARNNLGTWQYNSNTSAGATNVSWTNATNNNQNGAISQAVSVVANQMTGTQINALRATQWGNNGGFSTGVTPTLDFAASFYTSINNTSPVLDQITVTYLGDPNSGIMTIGTRSLGSGQNRDIQLAPGETMAMYLSAATGNVGIGTTSPSYKLDVQGGQINSSDGFCIGGSCITSWANAGGSVDGSGAAGHIAFWSDNNTVTYDSASSFYWDSVNHRLGIGTTAPSAQLSLDGGYANTKLAVYDSGGTLMGVGAQANQFRFHVNASTQRFSFLSAPNGNELLTILGTGNLGIGNTNPSAYLQIKAGTATAGTAPLKFTSGTNLTTAEAGAFEYDGTNLYFTPTGTTRKTVTYAEDTLVGGNSSQNGYFGNVYLDDTDASNHLILDAGSNLTADRILTLTTGDAARTLSLSGNLTLANNLTTSGNYALTLTSTAATNVTLPTTGTLATLAGTETLTSKTLTSPRIGTSILDVNGNNLFALTATGSAVNYLTYANAATGGVPTFTATGTDPNISISFMPKGTGGLGIGITSPSEMLDVNGRLHIAQLAAPSTTTDKLYNVSGALYWNGAQVATGSSLPVGTTGQTLYYNGSAWTASSLLYNSGTAIGIGTTAPSYNLSVYNSNAGVNNFIDFGYSNIYAWTLGRNSSTGSFTLGYTNTSTTVNNVLTVTNSGNVGIGATSPATKLDVVGDTFLRSTGFAGTATLNFSNNGPGYGAQTVFKVTASGLTFSQFNGSGMTDQLYIQAANGYVGIGTTNPSHKLDVVGNDNANPLFTAINNADAQYVPGFEVNAPNLTAGHQNYFAVGRDRSNNNQFSFGFFYAGAGSTANRFDVNAYATAPLLSVQAGGNVGIGTTNPSGLLEIRNTSGSSVNMGITGAGSYSSLYFTTAANGVGGLSYNNKFQIGTSASVGGAIVTKFLMDSAGNVGIGITNPSEILDVNGRVHISQTTAPSTTTDKLYNVGGNLYWNGAQVATGTALPTGTTGQTLYYNGSAWTATGNLYNDGTNIGIGTTAPASLLSIYSSTADSVLTLTAASATYDPLMKFRTGVTPAVQFSLGVDTADSNKFKIYSGDGLAGTSEFSIDTNGVTSISNLEMGEMAFATNAGVISWMDMPVTSTAATGTVESYTAQLDGNPMLSIYGKSDGAGSVNTLGVGIGTATPAGLFDVNGLLTVLSNGNVGIGTTSPTEKLAVTGNSLILTASGNTEVMRFSNANSVTTAPDIQFDSAALLSSQSNFHIALDSDNNATNSYFSILTNANTTAGTELLRVQENGYMGIGTTNPLEMLQVAGNVRTYMGGDGNGYFAYNAISGGNHIFSITRQSSPSAASVAISAYGGLGFSTGAASGPSTAYKMVIDNNGNVGIGTTAPAYALDVKAAGTGVIARFQSTNATGCTVATDGTISCSSDENLKKNISDLNYGLDALLQLRPVSYNWRTESDSVAKSLGFIAQDVEQVIPKLVMTDANGYKQLNTIGLIPVITQAIQEQQSVISDQGTMINGQKSEIEKLTSSALSSEEKMAIISDTLTQTNTSLAQLQSDSAALINKQTELETKLTDLKNQMELLKTQSQAVINFALALDTKSLLYKDALGNLDLGEGKLVAEGIETGNITIKVADPDKKTIGQAEMTPVQKDENLDGIDDDTNSDGKSVEVKTKSITANCKIFVTPQGDTGGAVWTEKVVDPNTNEYTGFKIKVSSAVKSNVKVDWFIVEEK